MIAWKVSFLVSGLTRKLLSGQQFDQHRFLMWIRDLGLRINSMVLNCCYARRQRLAARTVETVDSGAGSGKDVIGLS